MSRLDSAGFFYCQSRRPSGRSSESLIDPSSDETTKSSCRGISRDGLHAAYLADFPAMVQHRPSGEILRLLVFEFDVRENLLSCEFFSVAEIAHVVEVQDIPVAFFLKPEDKERNPQPIENDVNGFLAIQFFKGDGTAHEKTAVGAERFEDFGDCLHTG